MACVGIRDVHKSFGSVKVLHGIDIEIQDEEFVVLVGASGCGKSTLLRLIAGLETVTGGEIYIGGEPVSEMPPKHRDVAMVFQNYALYPHKTVFNNIAFGLRLRRMLRDEIAARVHQAAKILNLTELLDRYPKQLSGGQRQRVAMGRAIVRDPKAFLFDEPLSNLDAKLRVQMRAEIKALHQRLRTTTIYVTHDQVEAMTMADRIVVMAGGAVEQMGAPLDVYDNPAHLHVAGFIGSPSMNFISGRVTRNGEQAWVVGNDGHKWPMAHNAPAEEGRDVVYGIRPEHLSISPIGTNGGVNAAVMVVEPTGHETTVIAETSDSQVTVIADGRQQLEPGQAVSIRPDFAHIHLFDAKTSCRIS